jgi:class 3 adenylate cyclase
VILAARIAAQARGGEVLVSSDLRAAVAGEARVGFTAERELELKGLAGFHTVFSAEWQPAAETVPA